MTEPTERETMEFDVVIVGAGPAGLAAAIRLKQLAAEAGQRHLGGGAGEGLPGWRPHSLRRRDRSRGARQAPARLARAGLAAQTAVTEDRFYYLSETGGIPLPSAFMPPLMSNHRLLHRQPRQSLPLARRAGRSAGRRGLSRHLRDRGDVRPQWRGRGRHHRRHGRCQGWGAQGQLYAGDRADGQIHAARRRRARLA